MIIVSFIACFNGRCALVGPVHHVCIQRYSQITCFSMPRHCIKWMKYGDICGTLTPHLATKFFTYNKTWFIYITYTQYAYSFHFLVLFVVADCEFYPQISWLHEHHFANRGINCGGSYVAQKEKHKWSVWFQLELIMSLKQNEIKPCASLFDIRENTATNLFYSGWMLVIFINIDLTQYLVGLL